MFLYHFIKTSARKPKLIKENSIPPCRAGPLAPVHMENFHLIKVGSRQNQVRSRLEGLPHFSYEHVFISFLKKVGQPTWPGQVIFIWTAPKPIKKLTGMQELMADFFLFNLFITFLTSFDDTSLKQNSFGILLSLILEILSWFS